VAVTVHEKMRGLGGFEKSALCGLLPEQLNGLPQKYLVFYT